MLNNKLVYKQKYGWDAVVGDIFWETSDYYLSNLCASIISATGFVIADVVHEYGS